MRRGLCLLLFVGAAACQQAPGVEQGTGAAVAAPDCSYDREAMLALDVGRFDSTPGEGWRVVGNVPGCELAGADLLELYRTRHDGLTTDEEAGLRHHEFQLRAAAGQTERAIAMADSLIVLRYDDVAMRSYHQAEAAFLARDLDRLKAARDQLAALPEPEGFREGVEKFKAKYPKLAPPVWPVNLDVVEGLINCFDKPYAEAYTFTCRPPRPVAPEAG